MSPQDYFPLFISYEFPFLLLPFFLPFFELSTLRYTYGWIVSFLRIDPGCTLGGEDEKGMFRIGHDVFL